MYRFPKTTKRNRIRNKMKNFEIGIRFALKCYKTYFKEQL